MFTTVGQQIAYHSEYKQRSARVVHPDVGDQSGSTARTALSTGYEFNIILLQSNSNSISVADGEDADPMTVEILSSD